MKKIILLLFAVISLSSCDINCCMNCDGRGCQYCKPYGCAYCNFSRNGCSNCNRGYVNRNSGGGGYGDVFCADKLLGTWQMDYPSYVGDMELKEIKFIDEWKCDITFSVGRNPDWYTHTYSYSYSSGYIRFTRSGSTFSFKVERYLFPELYLRDSFGTYTWRKVRAYGC